MADSYAINVARFGTHRLIAEEIGPGKVVLDVGCNKGYLKSFVPDSQFYGIDLHAGDLDAAMAAGYREVYRVDLNRFESFKPGLEFDVIVFADILEHLMRPHDVLCDFAGKYLKENGVVIISLPNVANFTVRAGLLFGRFDYTESGILDKTHLHLYTLRTARSFIKSCGLGIIREKFSSNYFGWAIKLFPFLSGFLGHNLIFVCKKRY